MGQTVPPPGPSFLPCEFPSVLRGGPGRLCGLGPECSLDVKPAAAEYCSARPVCEQPGPQPLQVAPAKRVQDDVIPEGSFSAHSDHSTISCSLSFFSHDSA